MCLASEDYIAKQASRDGLWNFLVVSFNFANSLRPVSLESKETKSFSFVFSSQNKEMS